MAMPTYMNLFMLGHLVPVNRPALSAILKSREQGSKYHSDYITEIEYCGDKTPCFELALGGLPEGVRWRIGRGCDGIEHAGVEFLLRTHDSGIAGVHASLGFSARDPGLFLMELNDQKLVCTVNGRDSCHGNQIIPLENTILIGDSLKEP
ncbi:predicted protein [Pyrenophora tritici-repentis Pt-1C-BFP]|uniref:Uncharacterized protein n=1 Tax=Pyrenophora tritici-repentis (strain Pt-1C-BFP) TaxID=426418 RepID=B2W5K6_PYRTR|nr:uncharacterized protein PTRG_04906 [Pyrenophora tritici-repentis Pt-1C-BFP]EDU47813.1 predicted protein [Pyrenophora tritici-repentis Pt-1C-BFP]